MPFENASQASQMPETITRHADLCSTPGALCERPCMTDEPPQVAFFLHKQEHWKLAASGQLTSHSEAILSVIVPAEVSLSLLGSPNALFDGFSARHLYSGTGELLGLFVCLAGPENCANCIAAHDMSCRMAALAIEQRNLLDELIRQADRDAMTGLRSRTCFERLLAARLEKDAASLDKDAVSLDKDAASLDKDAVSLDKDAARLALLCINLDRFRLVNGVLGHSLGNRVLKCAGIRFQSILDTLPLHEQAVLARVGGDEFAVLTAAAQAVPVAESLLEALAQPFSVDEHQLFIGASIGIGCAHSGTSPESLQREAFVALYCAKRAGKGRWLQFHPSMAAIAPERLEMEKCLRSALAKNEMTLFYQPQVELASGLVCGAEALLRWNPAGLGHISPSAFVPILEETGLIVEFGQWVLREACRQGIKWRRETGNWLRLAVNVSTVQFRTPAFAAAVQRILAETGFPPEYLELELTESIFIGDFVHARRVFGEIQKIGVVVTIDDFGIGQSSLSYLHNLPFQRLKIDQSFIAALSGPECEKCTPLIANIIGMAASLGMTSVAEGIDCAGHVEILRSLGCDEGQGYYFSPPLPPGEFLNVWMARSVE